MERITTVTRDSMDELLEHLSAKLGVASSSVVPFTDHTDMMTALLGQVAAEKDELLVGSHASPDIAIAADRAGLRVREVLGASPFVNHPEDMLDAIGSDEAVVYLANPNCVTGSNYSLSHLNRIAQALPNGTLILDEKYYDYYGISGLPLIEQYGRVVIIRSLTAGFSIGSDDSGYLVGTPRFVNGFKDIYAWSRITTTLYQLLSRTLANEEVSAKRLTQVHNEALRLTNELTSMGVQNRLTTTDFLLLRVADPMRVGNSLAGYGTPVENLEGYPDLAHYLRYRIQSPLSNDKLLSAFRRMPNEYYEMADVDKRAVMFHRPQERAVRSGSGAERPRAPEPRRSTRSKVLAAK